MSDERGLMRFQRPTDLAPRTDKIKVAKVHKEASVSIEHQNMIALLGANGARMTAELSVYSGGVFAGVVDQYLGSLRACADDQEKYKIMEEFSYQMMEISGTRLKDLFTAASLGIEAEVVKYSQYKAPESTIWEKLFGD